MKSLRPALVMALAAAALLSTGCTLPKLEIIPTSLEYTERPNLVEYENQQQKLLRVAVAEDTRPAVEMEGSEPRAVYLLLFNWRIGEYITGDKAWKPSGTVSEAATVSLQRTMRQANFFEEVKAETTPNPSGGSGIILKTTVESLYASQRYKGLKYFLLYFETTEEKGTPAGHCKLKYQIIDAETGITLHEGKAEAHPKDNKAAIAELGARALQEAQIQVANKVNQYLSEL